MGILCFVRLDDIFCEATPGHVLIATLRNKSTLKHSDLVGYLDYIYRYNCSSLRVCIEYYFPICRLR